MARVRNVLFLMCDQLRWDYLSSYGHPTLQTPNLDALAERGVRFTNAFVQSPSCGPSRMSFYTGRYVNSHRSFANFVPLPVDELTIGDYLRPLGIQAVLEGKTHVEPNFAALNRLGVDFTSASGRMACAGGFVERDRHDGVLADPTSDEALSNQYARFLREHGYHSENPWLDFANSAQSPAGEPLSGWSLRHARLPARVKEEHSETAYTTQRGIDFIRAQGDSPWFLHLSYIKPHWPYVAPAPYHAVYNAGHVIPARRNDAELDQPHPLYASYLKHAASRTFSRHKTRETVIPVYMGLIKQIDDQLGKLFEFLDRSGRMGDTLIVFTSDHGDYLGDHFLGEKELYHDCVNRIPLIVYDPDARSDSTRGTACSSLVESIDILPTCLNALGLAPPSDTLEGRSLLPILESGETTGWRDRVYCEFDYSFRGETRRELGRSPKHCATFTIRTQEWKYVHVDGFRPILFDLRNDPDEFHDLGADPNYEPVCRDFQSDLFCWLIARKRYTSVNESYVTGFLDDARFNSMAIGQW
jgi:arylsulfatase A-like enzyme